MAHEKDTCTCGHHRDMHNGAGGICGRSQCFCDKFELHLRPGGDTFDKKLGEALEVEPGGIEQTPNYRLGMAVAAMKFALKALQEAQDLILSDQNPTHRIGQAAEELERILKQLREI